MLVSDSLTHSLTHSLLFSKLDGLVLSQLLDDVATAHVDAEDHVGNSLLQTRPKPAYGRQGLDWIVGPGYSFVVFSTVGKSDHFS